MCDSNTGTCQSGVCTPNDLCAGVDCSDDNDCTADVCTDGICSNPNLDPNTPCSQDGGNVCDGASTCVECNASNQCPAAGVCQVATCIGNSCGTANDEDGADCDAGGGPASGSCSAGECVADVSCPPPTITGQAQTACRNSFNQLLSQFPVDYDIALDDCAFAGQTFNADVTPTLNFAESFLNTAADNPVSVWHRHLC